MTHPIELKIQLPTGVRVMLETHDEDTIMDIKNLLMENIECCYVTSYELVEDKTGKPVDAYNYKFDGLQTGDSFTMKFKKYDDKDLRLHISHLQELLMSRLDEVMLSIFPVQVPVVADKSTDPKSYPSIYKSLGQNLKGIVDDPEGFYQASFTSTEYAFDVECTHSAGFTSAQDKKLTEQSVRRPLSVPEGMNPPGSFSELFSENKTVKVSPYLDILKQVPVVKFSFESHIGIIWSGYNPPPRQRKLQGDLGYIDITMKSGYTPPSIQVTCTPGGFYVNQTKHAVFNPVPASKPCHSETLLGLILQVWPKYKEKVFDLLRLRVSLHPFETGSTILLLMPTGMDYPANGSSSCGGAKFSEHSPAVAEHLAPVRQWNQVTQEVLSLPDDDFQQQYQKQKQCSRAHTEYIDFATRSAMNCADGQVLPLSTNGGDTADSLVYVVSDTFISQALDNKLLKDPPKGLARVMAKQDLHGISALRECKSDLRTVSTVVLDYKGKRILCQALIPGILLHQTDGQVAAPQQQGWDDSLDAYIVNDDVQIKLQHLAKQLHCAPHTMINPDGSKVIIHINTEIKIMKSSDGDCYLLECGKTLPRDLNWRGKSTTGETSHEPLAFIRQQCLQDYVKSKRNPEEVAEVEKLYQLTIKQGTHPVQAYVEREQRLRELDVNSNISFNCDLFTYCQGMVSGDDDETIKQHTEQLEDLALFLKAKIPPLVKRLQIGEITDPAEITSFLHDQGVNMRYLGEIAKQLPSWAIGAKNITIIEMVSRIIKHKIRAVMSEAENTTGDLLTPLVCYLNKLLGGEGSNLGMSKSQVSKKKKKKNKPTIHEESDKESDWIEREVLKRFDYNLPQGWINGINRFILLRSICYKTGLCIAQREIDFSSSEPITLTDLVDILPTVSYPEIRFSIVEGMSHSIVHEESTLVGRKLHQGLDYVNQIVGTICKESAFCYQAIADYITGLALPELDHAIQHQFKSLLIARRLYGPAHGALIPQYQKMSRIALLAGRCRVALQYQWRAMYLAKLFSSSIPYDMYVSLADIYMKAKCWQTATDILRKAAAIANDQFADSGGCQHADDLVKAVSMASSGDPNGAALYKKACEGLAEYYGE